LVRWVFSRWACYVFFFWLQSVGRLVRYSLALVILCERTDQGRMMRRTAFCFPYRKALRFLGVPLPQLEAGNGSRLNRSWRLDPRSDRRLEPIEALLGALQKCCLLSFAVTYMSTCGRLDALNVSCPQINRGGGSDPVTPSEGKIPARKARWAVNKAVNIYAYFRYQRSPKTPRPRSWEQRGDSDD
jgi:hypothetical protein